MSKNYIIDKIFDKGNFTEAGLPKGEYENCTFINCDFSGSDLSNINFSECFFTSCNLSMTKLAKTSFRDVRFKGCKLLGMHFENCNDFLFTVTFENCLLNLSSFYKLKMKKTSFKDCSLHEVDFTETDLSGSLFHNCDFTLATFEHTGLEGVDFRTSFNYLIDPELNRIKKARFSREGLAGLLTKYDIDIE